MAPDRIFNFKLRSGITIAGRYELGHLIGRGGMGEVWAAKHVALDAKHAIKFMDPALLREHDADTVQGRFEDEAKATSAISRLSRHVVSVSDYGKHDGIPYLVMEHLEGDSLEALLVREKCFSPQRAAEILEQINRGVTQAHKAGLIHRDLKPGNIYICKDETGGLLVKVLDFGLVRSVTDGNKRLTQRGIAVGTPNYMSPEQARAHPNMDHQCDLWSLAVLAYEMITGKSPWVGETMQDVLVAVCRSEFSPASSVKPDLGTGFDAFFSRAFQRKAENRFPSGDALVTAFRASVAQPVQPVVIDVEPGPDSAYTSTDSLIAPRRGNWKFVAIAILSLLLVVSVGVSLRVRKGSEEPQRVLASTLATPTTTQGLAPTAEAHPSAATTIVTPQPTQSKSTATARGAAQSASASPPRSAFEKPVPPTPATIDPPHVTPQPVVTRPPVDQSKIF